MAEHNRNRPGCTSPKQALSAAAQDAARQAETYAKKQEMEELAAEQAQEPPTPEVPASELPVMPETALPEAPVMPETQPSELPAMPQAKPTEPPQMPQTPKWEPWEPPKMADVPPMVRYPFLTPADVTRQPMEIRYDDGHAPPPNAPQMLEAELFPQLPRETYFETRIVGNLDCSITVEQDRFGTYTIGAFPFDTSTAAAVPYYLSWVQDENNVWYWSWEEAWWTWMLPIPEDPPADGGVWVLTDTGWVSSKTLPIDIATPPVSPPSTTTNYITYWTQAGGYQFYQMTANSFTYTGADGQLHSVTINASSTMYIDGNGVPQMLANGDNGQVLKMVNGLPAWNDDTHDLLSARHGDTVAAAVEAGAIISGVTVGGVPKWSKIAAGNAGEVLKIINGLPAWNSDTHDLLSARHGDTTTGAVEVGAIVGAVTTNGITTWSKIAPSGAQRVVKYFPTLSTTGVISWEPEPCALLDGSRHSDASSQNGPPNIGTLIVGTGTLNEEVYWMTFPASTTNYQLIYSDDSTDAGLKYTTGGAASRPLRRTTDNDGVEWFDGPTETFTILVDFRVNGTTLQVKTKSLTVTEGLVTAVGTTSDWTTVHTGTTCT